MIFFFQHEWVELNCRNAASVNEYHRFGQYPNAVICKIADGLISFIMNGLISIAGMHLLVLNIIEFGGHPNGVIWKKNCWLSVLG